MSDCYSKNHMMARPKVSKEVVRRTLKKHSTESGSVVSDAQSWQSQSDHTVRRSIHQALINDDTRLQLVLSCSELRRSAAVSKTLPNTEIFGNSFTFLKDS